RPPRPAAREATRSSQGLTTARRRLGTPHTNVLAEAFVILTTRPIDPSVASDLAIAHVAATRLVDGDLVRLDLGRTIDVVVPAVPQLLTGMPLPDVGELVEHAEIQNPLLSGLEVPEAGDDVPLVIVDVHVHVLGDDVAAAVAKDLLPQAVRENRAERRRPIE